MAEALDGAQAIDQKTLTLLSAETVELPIRDAGRIPQVWILRHSRPLQKARCKMWVSHFAAHFHLHHFAETNRLGVLPQAVQLFFLILCLVLGKAAVFIK